MDDHFRVSPNDGHRVLATVCRLSTLHMPKLLDGERASCLSQNDPCPGADTQLYTVSPRKGRSGLPTAYGHGLALQDLHRDEHLGADTRAYVCEIRISRDTAPARPRLLIFKFCASVLMWRR